MFRRNFLFGKDGGTANLIDVGSEDLYQPGKGYGFVTEKNRREQKLLQIRELNSSFRHRLPTRSSCSASDHST